MEIKETKTNDSLIRKTKKELVDIIFRKDDIEKKLRSELKNTNNIIKDFNDKYDNILQDFNKLNNSYSVLLSDYQELSDNSVSLICELKNKIHKSVNRFLISITLNVIFILITILNLLFN